MLKLRAPAKINLTLEVLGKREDGYHDISSVIQAVGLCDSLSFRRASGITVECDAPGWVAEKSLVPRAAALLVEAAGGQGAAIKIEKRIPLLSGLGGDSSAAATTLSGLNQLWELDLPGWDLAEMASSLGSDVPFFIFGGTAMMCGRGDIVTLLPSLPRMWVVLLLPPVERAVGKTRRLYESLSASHYTGGKLSDEMVHLISTRRPVPPSALFNVFEAVAFDAFEGLERYRRQFLEAGAHQVNLAGSGPALFSLLKDKGLAKEIHDNLKKKGLEVYLVETVTSRV
jgi:4-diphosphocytidyl-2-C-methyl-D-erythritol kinase